MTAFQFVLRSVAIEDLCEQGHHNPMARLSGSRLARMKNSTVLPQCEWEGVVVSDEAPLGGVAQVVSHGVKVVAIHGEEGKEKDEEVQVEVKGEVEENQEQPHMDGMWMKVKDSRTT